MQNRFAIFLIGFIGFSFFANAQTKIKREKFWSVGFNLGILGWSPTAVQTTTSTHFQRTLNYGAGDVSDVNGKKSFAIIANTSIGLHGGYLWYDKSKKNQTGIYAEFQKNKACYSFTEPFSYSYKGDTVGGWVDADNYLKYSIGIMRTLNFSQNRLDDDSPWYIKICYGQTFLHTSFGVSENTGTQEDWTESGTGMKLTVLSASKQSGMISTEIGKKFLVNNDNSFDIGVVYHLPLINTRTIEYEFFSSNTSLGKSQITYFGSTIMLNASWNFNYRIKEKPIDSTKIKQFNDLAIDSTEIKHHESKFHHHKINGRKFDVQQTISVSNDEITVQVWDKNKVDGDEISLYLNGKPILENYTVSKTKKEIKIKLQPGANIIVMHALNLGRIPPNTAALNINDGYKKKIITLVSDLHKSGALEIIYNP